MILRINKDTFVCHPFSVLTLKGTVVNGTFYFNFTCTVSGTEFPCLIIASWALNIKIKVFKNIKQIFYHFTHESFLSMRMSCRLFELFSSKV